MPNVAIIGIGGGGSWLAQLMCKLLKNGKLLLVDGDRLEEKNLDRQLFRADQIGMYKVEAMASMLQPRSTVKVEVFPYYVNAEQLDEIVQDKMDCKGSIFSCVDNHPGRRTCLAAAKHKDINVIVAGNEYTDYDAYIWNQKLPKEAHPYQFWPEIETVNDDDPLKPSCTGALQEAKPQLALSNLAAITMAAQLWYWWETELREKFKGIVTDATPVQYRGNSTRTQTVLLGQINEWRHPSVIAS